MNDISAIVLTFNEEIHIRRCLDNAFRVAKDVYVIDSFSTDRTVEIAKGMGAVVLQNKWVNYATQFNWGLDNAPIKTKWVLRLDADEYLEDDLIEEIQTKLPNEPEEVTGIEFHFKVKFLNKWMKHASPSVILMRLFRYGIGRSEVRLMDEHIVLSKGISKTYDGAFVDHNLNNITWWAQEHIGYAKRETADLLNIEYDFSEESGKDHVEGQAGGKRELKNKYAHKKLFWRSFAYFLYRYFYKRGFMDGKEGFLWCFMQGWWYRTLVDIQVYQIKHECKNTPALIEDYLKNQFGIEFKRPESEKRQGGVILKFDVQSIKFKVEPQVLHISTEGRAAA